MEYELNHLNQPVGRVVRDWRPPPHPGREPMEGRYCRLEPLDPDLHAESLFAANSLDVGGKNWTYLPYGPFESLKDYRAWMERDCRGNDPLFYAIVDLAREQAVGVASYLRITPGCGSIETGHNNYFPLLYR